MFCTHCGIRSEGADGVCSVCGQPLTAEAPAEAPAPNTRKPRPKPHIALRILLQVLSFALCLVLLASLTATVTLADLNRVMSKNGIRQLVTALISPAPRQAVPVVGAGGVLLAEPGFTVPDVDISDIPEDILSGGDSEENISSLVSWLYEQLAGSSGQTLPITEEQVQALVKNSTISDFIAEKLAGFAQDFIHNTQNTAVTADEVVAILEENMGLIEESLGIRLNDQTKNALKQSVHKLVVEQNLTGTIQNQVFDSMEEAINDSVASTGMTWEQIQPAVQFICSDTLLYTAIGICLALMLLMVALNFYNVPGGLTWAAVPCILVGGFSTAALSAVPAIPGLPAAAAQVLSSFSRTLLPNHVALLVFGLALLIASIVWRVLRRNKARNQEAPAP